MDQLSTVTQWISNFIHDTLWGIGFLIIVGIIILLAKALAENPNIFGNEGGGAL